MTPNLARIHIQNPHWRGLRLWIPLFLLWIPLILLSPLLLLILLPVCFLWRIGLWRTISVFWGIFCGLRGTDVLVKAQGNQILVEIL
jgi:hypothetical protein